MIPLMTVKMARALLVLPIVVVAIALVPTLVIFPLLSDRQGRRVLCLVKQVRAWHADLASSVNATEIGQMQR